MPQAEQALKNFRLKFPGAYDDMGDQELLTAIQRKWPGSYDDLVIEPTTQEIPAIESKSKPGFLGQAVGSMVE